MERFAHDVTAAGGKVAPDLAHPPELAADPQDEQGGKGSEPPASGARERFEDSGHRIVQPPAEEEVQASPEDRSECVEREEVREARAEEPAGGGRGAAFSQHDAAARGA
jgi:hypothetical protein